MNIKKILAIATNIVMITSSVLAIIYIVRSRKDEKVQLPIDKEEK